MRLLQEHQLNTEKEPIMGRPEKKDLMDRIRQIEVQMHETEQEINSSCGVHRGSVQYETDEDELKRETDWIVKKKAKMHKVKAPPYVTPEKEHDNGSRQAQKINVANGEQLQ